MLSKALTTCKRFELASAKLNLWPVSECLLSRLEDYLEKTEGQDLRKLFIILPTQRLITRLMAGLAYRWQGVLAPQVGSIETLSRQLHLPAPVTKAASDNMIEFLLRHLIESGSWEHLYKGHERELKLLLGEMHEQNVRQDAFPNLERYLAEDIYKNEEHLGSLHTRCQEIATIVELAETELAKRGLAVPQAVNAREAVALGEAIEAGILSNFEKVMLVGYTSLAPSWDPVLKALCQQANVDIWLHEPPKLYQKSSPLANLINRLASFGLSKEPSQGQQQSVHDSEKYIVELNSVHDECAFAIHTAKTLISAGVAASQIAFLATQEGYYRRYLRQMLVAEELPHNSALAFSLNDTLLGQWLRSFATLCCQDLHLTHFLAWFRSPITKHQLTQHPAGEQEPYAGELYHQTLASLAGLGMVSEMQELEQRLESLEQKKIVQAALTMVRDFKNLREAPLTIWLAKLYELFDTSAIDQFCEPGLEEAIREYLKEFRIEVEQLGDLLTASLNLPEFFQYLEDYFLTGELRHIGEPLSGLQLINLAEARQFPFRYVFILGCNEGSFPKATPKDELLDDFLKQQLGLPGWHALEEMEDQTFHLLAGRIRYLWLCRPMQRNGELQVRSRFIEQLITEEPVKMFKNPILALNEYQATKDPSTDREGLLDQAPKSLWQSMSASAVEKLLRCPYQFLLHRLAVRDEKPIPLQTDVRLEGEWLHGVLEALFTGNYKNESIDEGWSPSKDEQIEAYTLQRLLTLTHRLAPVNFLESPAYFQLKLQSWPAFAKHLARLYGTNPERIKRGIREARFGKSDGDHRAQIIVNDQPRQIFGSIDAIDFPDGLTIITDYKRFSTPERRSAVEGFSPQLALYALCWQASSGESVANLVTGYWNILKGSWQHHGIGSQAANHAKTLKLCSSRFQSLEELIDNFLHLWSQREQSILDQQQFQADPGQCALCDYTDICRKEDPIHKDRLATQSIRSHQSVTQSPKNEPVS